MFIQRVHRSISVVKLVCILSMFHCQKKSNLFFLLGHALAKAGGQELRNELNQAAKTKSLANTSDGKFPWKIFSRLISLHILVAITDAPNLLASHVIHVNSPTWNAGSQEECITDLDKATMNILNLADKEGLTSVAIPSISSGK